MQENKTIRKRKQGLRVACALAVSTVLGCDSQSSPSSSASAPKPSGHSAAAYAALSSTLERCEDTYETCLNGATNDAAEQACEAQVTDCREQARTVEQDAKKKLDHEAHWCHKICSDDDAGPGGSDDADAGSRDLGDCILEKAPKLPRCTRGLVECVVGAGFFEGEATRNQITECATEAHECVRERVIDALRERWERRHGEAGSGGAAAGGTGGAAAGGTGGAIAAGGGGGSGGAAAVDDDADSDEDADESSDEGRGRGRGRGHHHRHFWFPFWH